MDGAMTGENVPFVDQLVSHTAHGLSARQVDIVMGQAVNDKYITLGGAIVATEKQKKSASAGGFVGPKRSKFRKLMSSRQRKANGFNNLSPECEKFEAYLPLHDLWKQYMATVLRHGKDSPTQHFAKADWHGALLSVSKSCSSGFVGISGIVLQETTHTFRIITRQNKYKIIPKTDTVFTVLINESLVATLYGNQILYKTGDRSVRKFKARQTIDIGN